MMNIWNIYVPKVQKFRIVLNTLSLFLTIQPQSYRGLYLFTLWWSGFFNSMHSDHSGWSYCTDWHLSTSLKKLPCVHIPVTFSSCPVCMSRTQIHLSVTPQKSPPHLNQVTPWNTHEWHGFPDSPRLTHILSARRS